MTDETRMAERAKEITDGRTDTPEARPHVDTESPLEEARKLKADLLALTETMAKERHEMERHRAEMTLSGQGWAGQKPITQEEKDKEDADKIINNFLG